MKAWKVGKDVGNVKNDNPNFCVKSLVGDDEDIPESPEPPPVQGGLFE